MSMPGSRLHVMKGTGARRNLKDEDGLAVFLGRLMLQILTKVGDARDSAVIDRTVDANELADRCFGRSGILGRPDRGYRHQRKQRPPQEPRLS